MSEMLGKLIEVIQVGDFVVLDTETTGLQRGEICEIAIVGGNGSVLYHSLVKTHDPIPMDATRIHGIEDAHVVNAPTWPDVLPAILPVLTGTHVLVYNATYDRKMMHQSAEVWGLAKTDWKTLGSWHCLMEAFAEVYGDWNAYHGNYRWQPLHRAAAHYQLDFEGEHSAIGDAKMAWRVACRMGGLS